MNTSDTTSATETTTFRAPIGEFITACQAVLPHTAKSDITPTLEHSRLTQTHLIASDRYTIGSWEFERPAEGEHSATETEAASDAHILMPRDAIEWVAKIVQSKLRHKGGRLASLYEIQVSQATIVTTHPNGFTQTIPGDVTVSIVTDGSVERSQAFDGYNGNFPALERLINGWEPALDAYPIRINPLHLEKVSTFAKRFEKEKPMQIELGKETDSGKPAPMRITFSRLTSIIQPNLILK